MIDIPDSFFEKDAQGRSLCPKCRRSVNACTCPSIELPAPRPLAFTPRLRLDRSGRKGKVVTLIECLPCDEDFIKTLAHDLKAATGSGGTFYIAADQGVIEIQGDHRRKIGDFLASRKSASAA